MVTLKKGEVIYRTPGKFGDNQWDPGKWFGAEPSKSKLDNELKYYIEIWDNPNEIQFMYRLEADVTVYSGKVHNGSGVQFLFPDDLGNISDLVTKIGENILK